ncbi:MAG TPA: AMP-binding protein [Gemmataceae bacterium]|jgi:long-chain-fatty-acid--[acyl-carrier-protein] ligase|nr:AMP-binding protein [Gemmataceae bacterium]
MLQPGRFVLWALTRALLWMRYRLRVSGLEQVRGLPGPTLVLPNHPGLIDPVLVLTALWRELRPRPMMYEGNFQNPVLYPLMKILDAVRVPDLEQASVQARARAEEAVATVVEGLKKGETHVMWPSGRLQRDGVERLGGARAVADILQAVPEANVVLVRTRGVWGSMFSFAPTGEHPHLLGRLSAGLGWLLANLLFFMPRRKVEITVEKIDRGKLPGLTREELNPWLEKWYNEGGPEAPTYVPYHFLFGRRTFEFPKRVGLADADLGKVKPETREEVAHILADKLGRPLTDDEKRPETTLDQLGLDSLDRMELTLTVEQRFGFSGDQSPATVGQLWALAQGLVERGPPKPPPENWFHPPSGPKAEIVGDTVAEAFVRRALANPKDVACADDLAGAMTYEKLLVGARTMARRFRKLPGTNVGLMLPSSVACDVALLGLYLAGKLPVVLNWTTGPANLAHAARTMQLTHVVSSRAFLDRSGVTVEGVEYVTMEELRQQVGRWELLRALLRVRFSPGRVRARVPQAAPDQPAVVLFTSGSEKAPKAVPLTHTNILSDLRAAIPHFEMTREMSILGFLPAFHSFGLSVTGLFPLLSGIRVARHPDPTDAGGLARKVAAYKPTILAGTPTFVSHILDRAKPDQLTSLRMIVVGAEKCPPGLFERCAQVAPGAVLLEGYGITECSPVVSANRPHENRPGTIGKPLPGVEVSVVELDGDAALPAGEQGMLLVSGPTVFPGYLGHEGPQPFRERDGQRWYVTGDLAKIDADGFIHFAGRLKRFIKAGGEMISLPALEEPFARLYPPSSEGPRVAVEGVETEGGRRVVLFSTEPLEVREANKVLEKEGFRGVMRLDEVRRVPSIPVLGTGKTDYKVLRGMIAGK